ncbi:MAG TPA: transposase [Terriglobales bacterium]|nr:transposase [Terriglobales bacterium]
MSIPKRAPFALSDQTYFVSTKCFGGQHLLQSERCALLLIDTLYHYRKQGKYALHAFVVMPDHLHALLSPADITLERTMQLIKGGYSYRRSKELELPGEAWQRGYSDHRVRDLSDYRIHLSYNNNNPVKRGLCRTPESFPYSSANGKYELDRIPQRLKPEF